MELKYGIEAAPAAYVGSVYHSIALQASLLHMEHIDTLLDYYSVKALPLINTTLPVDQQVSPDKLMDSSEPQHLLSSISAAAKLKELLAEPLTPFQRAVISACCLPGSGTWLLHLPPFGSRMTSLEWQYAAKFRLGKPLFPREVTCPCCKRELLDVFGIHACYCSSMGGAKSRHDLTRDKLASFMASARMQHRVETGFLLTDTHAGPKPADIYLPHWTDGRAACVDLTIVNSVSTCFANRPFDAMEPFYIAENAKFSKYADVCSERGLTLIPFVLGSHGGFNESAVDLMKDIGSAWSQVSDLPASVAIANIRRSLVYEVQLVQARSWILRGELAEFSA